MPRKKYTITGMSCAACSAYIQNHVSELKGVKFVNVNLLVNTMDIDFDSTIISEDEFISVIKKGGYDAKPYAIELNENIEEKSMKKRLISSIALSIILMYFSMGQMIELKLPTILHRNENLVLLALVECVISLIVMIINKKFFIKGIPGIISGSFNMDSLVSVGSLVSFAYSVFVSVRIAIFVNQNNFGLVTQYKNQLYFESAAMVLTLVTLGKYLETKSKKKTTDAIRALLEIAPDKALLKVNNNIKEVSIDEIKIGDEIIVKPGARVPVDGIIVMGHTSIDESSLTGESIPVDKNKGDNVYTATLNNQGNITIKATNVGEDTTFAKMVQYVKDASSSKAPIAKLADKIARIFVPIVFIISIISFLIWFVISRDFDLSLNFAITILVISCPCALGLATPTAIMVASGVGAKNGIFIKNGESLEQSAYIDTLVFDKTGTITIGKPQVTKVISYDDKILEIAYSLEKMSSHPLSKAIVDYANKNHISSDYVLDYEEIFGMGIKGCINSRTYIAGNEKMMIQYNISCDSLENIEELEKLGNTVIYIAEENNNLLGIIAIADKIKSSSISLIDKLKNKGYKTIILSGDKQSVADSIGNKLGVNEIYAEVLPKDKANIINKLKNKSNKIAMIGDGINDSPALVTADIGIAMGAGADIAIESADIVISGNDMNDILSALRLSKKTLKTIKENLFWAFIYNIICIPIAAGVLYPKFSIRLNPMFGAAAMCFSSVFVVTNALRIRNFKPEPKENLIEEDDLLKGEDIMKKIVNIEGMMCMHCVSHATNALENLGFEKVKVDLNKNQAVVKCKDKEISDDEIIKAISDAGYKVTSIIIK